MSNIEIARQLYQQCKDLDFDETRELVLMAESEEEIEFFSLLGDFILQKQQQKVIEQGRF
ncbi:MAG: hypothetical protein HFG32_13550 [Eubacterium sp.]|jgi:hypothetical protein|nr:hypothetical protein [Eubacterium sp.]